jgi:5,10-methenyltetrahydromethanopterin hydrogenase
MNMEVTGKDIEEFADTADTGALRKYALITAQILSKTQLKALQKYFARPIILTVPNEKVAPQGSRIALNAAPVVDEDEDEGLIDDEDTGDEEGDDIENLLETTRDLIQEPPKNIPPPPKPAQDFGFPEAARPRGRPPTVSREQAEQEFQEIIRRRQASK